MTIPHREFLGKTPQNTLPVAALLILAAGMLDAYTYVGYGGVFANAMTGNIVLLMIRLAQGDFATAVRFVAPIVAYVCGVAVAHAVKEKPLHGLIRYPARVLLAVEIAFLVVVALTAGHMAPLAVITGIAFVAAMQATAFTRVGPFVFTSVTTSANLRHLAESFMAAVVFRDGPTARKELFFFAVVVGCFFAGAAAGAVLTLHLGKPAVWLPVVLLSAALILCMPWNRPMHEILKAD